VKIFVTGKERGSSSSSSDSSNGAVTMSATAVVDLGHLTFCAMSAGKFRHFCLTAAKHRKYLPFDKA
jgi:hypothetical protein